MKPNIRNKDVLNCLPLLASVLGNQYGVEVRIGGDRAATNGKVILLPSLPMDADSKLLTLARGYLDHESGHIRYTDHAAVNAAQMDAVTKFLWNSIEDWRIERRMGELFPGCRQNLRWLMRHLFLENRDQDAEKAEVKTPAFSILNYVLFTVRAWDVPELIALKQEERRKLNTDFPGIAVQLDRILDRVRQYCPDTQTAIAYAHELAECIRNWMPASPENPATPKESTLSNKGDQANEEIKNSQTANSKKRGADGSQPPNGYGGQMEDDSQHDDAGDVVNPSDEKHGRTQKDSSSDATHASKEDYPTFTDAESQQATIRELSVYKGGVQDAIVRLSQQDTAELPQGIGQIIAGELQDNAAENSEKCVTVARAIERKYPSLTDEDKQIALRASTALRTRLQGLLQAKTLQQCQMGRRGRLHPASLYRLRIGNPWIFQRTVETHGLNTAVHILLDGSGSMTGAPMHLASLSCYAVAKALELIPGVNVGATVFPADYGSVDVCPLIKHGQRVSDNFSITPTGDTPLAEALWWVMQTMLRLKEDRRILLILTDGRPQRMEAAREALGSSPKYGIEFYGIGMMNNNIIRLLPGQSRVISTMKDLAPAMFEILQKVLIGGKYV